MPLFEGEHLRKYSKEGGFDLGALLYDDFLVAIKKLFADRHFASALKLLVCFIDTIAYLVYGVSSASSFKQWLGEYVDLNKVGVTADELWEHRNGLLHMTTLESRRVLRGSVKQLLPWVGPLPSGVDLDQGAYKAYSQQELQIQVCLGVARFVESLNHNRPAFDPFLKRYEQTISDSHYIEIPLGDR